MPDFSQALYLFGLAVVPALFGIICHEVAHGWVAYKMGDPTAKFLGRLTLNPVKHIDPMGLGVFAFTAMFSPFVIGWAKPVPVQPRYFRKPREGMILVSVAGPMTNFLVAVLCALILKLCINLAASGVALSGPLIFVMQSALFGITINCALAWFNLMPVPPLDGSHILGGLLPAPLARQYASLGRYGMLIIILLVATGVFRYVLVPLMSHSMTFISALFGVPGSFGQLRQVLMSVAGG